MSALPQPASLDVWNASTANAGVAILIAIGTLYCFLGYRALRFIIVFTGFCLAAPVAGALGAWLSHGNLAGAGIAAAIGGVAGAFAMLFLYKTGVFCVGLLGAALVAHIALTDHPESWVPWAIVGSGIAGGLVAIVIERLIVTLATAAIGACMVIGGIGFFFLGADVAEAALHPRADSQDWTLVASWAVLAFAGALAQFATYRRPKEVVRVVQQRDER
ncbi:MAG TPA: DUF4203 domain-containing protein [Candidatus Hydrogenedentes bacterium]|nr:DUF4203 domain-containing protein [Candidatus Hydrogenedentota bacterium]HOS01958.1 DUF4203 domain-containing protein [Candidatus Hydrogenedentota bacterium]